MFLDALSNVFFYLGILYCGLLILLLAGLLICPRVIQYRNAKQKPTLNEENWHMFRDIAIQYIKLLVVVSLGLLALAWVFSFQDTMYAVISTIVYMLSCLLLAMHVTQKLSTITASH